MIVFYQVFLLLTVLQNFLCGNDKIAKMVDLMAKAESHLLQLKKYRSSEFELSSEHSTTMKELLQGIDNYDIHDIPKYYLQKCKNSATSVSDQSTISTKTNGGIGNQLASFASLYSLSKLSNDTLRPGINFKQYQLLAPFFPFLRRNWNEYLIDSWYCRKICPDFDWHILDVNNTEAVESLSGKLKTLSGKFPSGHYFALSPYLNLAHLYLTNIQDIRSMLQIDSDIMKESKNILQKTLDEITWKPDAVIGIHVRSSREYLNHLKLLGLQGTGNGYYKKAITYFRHFYEKPIFVVVGDSREGAIKRVVDPNRKSKFYLKRKEALSHNNNEI